MIRFFLLATSLLLAGTLTDAQPHSTDFFVTRRAGNHRGSMTGVYRMTQSGQLVQTLDARANSGPWFVSPAMDLANRDLIVGKHDAFVVLDASTGAVVRTVSIAPRMFFQSFVPSHTGGLVFADRSGDLLHLADDWQTLTTLRTGLGTNAAAQAQDLNTGEYLVGVDTGVTTGIAAVSSDGRSASTLVTGLRLFHRFIQNHLDGSLVLVGEPLMRFDRATGLTTLSTRSFGTAGLAFDRSPGRGAITASYANVIQRIGTGGSIIATVASPIDYLTGICFGWGRNLATIRTGPGNRWRFRISFPNEGGRAYAMGVSVSGFTPGIRVGSRQIPLELDRVFVASLSGGLTPFLTSNVGVLRAAGQATADLDLSAFGSSLRGMLIWAAAATTTTNGPATVSKPVVIVLE